MPAAASRDIWLAPSYFQEGQVISTPRYRWSCWNRGESPFVILQWTQSGEGIFETAKQRLPVPVGHAFLTVIPERATYYYPPEAREPWVVTWMNFYGALACDLFKKFQAEFGHVIPLSSRGAAAAALRRLIPLTAPSGRPDRVRSSQLVYAFMLEWWREASQPTGGAEHGLTRALRFCRDHFREPLGVKQIANEAGMSREHFSRLFRERTKETPAAFLRRLRVDEAATLLRETGLPLREIAMRSGFYSARHLMRTFQRRHGVGPSEYRQRK